MNCYTIYNSEKIISILNCSEETLDLNVNEGESYVEGKFTDEYYYVKNNQLKEYPVKPDYPVTFNADTEQWVADDNLALNNFRQERNERLAATDWTQAADSPLSETDKQNYRTLRQILRDMPQADGFDPLNPVWPTLP
ncbi:MAG: hypothetical protein CMA66_00935 [Euryarchaeota archaeon]|jgi:hypothetical protein|nr:hypothetical protein [Euryarchaeota archaeon]|tara:strand:- start:3934 stop:4347 length:414 start_codon:yes stop_codon:yes gene_type:complete